MTREVTAEASATAARDVRDVVEGARRAASDWALIPAEGRAHILRQVRYRIYERRRDIIETIARECGKPRAEALTHEVIPIVLTLRYLEVKAPKALRPQRSGWLPGQALFALGSRLEWRPFGLVGCITPWNYPFLLSFMALAPALIAGNAVVLKPSELTPEVGERIREVLEPLPSGVATVVQGGGEVGEALVDAPCDKICFIGSAPTGRKIAERAARHLTPVVMELGGNDAAIICADADLEIASSGILWGSFMNAGQACCAVERTYVVDSVADAFLDKLASKLRRLREGERDGDVGRLTSRHQLDVVERHVKDAVDKGARVIAGGEGAARDTDGALRYPPTVLDGVSRDMAVMQEETLGPVLPIVRVADEAEALRRANQDGVNLSASVWSRDAGKARRIASQLHAGSILINDHGEAPGAPWAPWGGVGQSGYGRLHGVVGLREFVVPVQVSKNLVPRLKRVHWYPYDETTTELMHGVAKLFASPRPADKAGGLASLLLNGVRALKSKI